MGMGRDPLRIRPDSAASPSSHSPFYLVIVPKSSRLGRDQHLPILFPQWNESFEWAITERGRILAQCVADISESEFGSPRHGRMTEENQPLN
jgi:hypothetical protein